MFTHLHLHTEFSLLDGLAKIPALMERARSLGQEAMAITDHGNLYGAVDFYKGARQAGVHPVLGMEAYVAIAGRREREAKDRQYHHLTLLAANNTGWRNLIALSTRAHLDGFYYRPRIDRELLAEHHEGLIVLSGCPSSELHKALNEGRAEEAREIAGWHREVFGDRYYLEIQNHHDPQFTPTIGRTAELGRELGIPLVATHDSHYTAPGDAKAHEVLLCIGTNSTMDDPKRFKLEGEDFYLASEAEMAERFPDDPEALTNTTAIADRCHVELEFGRLRLPDPGLPAGVSAQEHLETIARAGLTQRYGNPSPEIVERLRYELSVVEETGFAEYFLIVRDFAQYAREQGIAMGVRGSAAASIILYCIGITDIDPMPHRLVFERFLNLERREMPDIDMDFADDRRDEVIRYVADKYGHDRVAQIITFGTLGAKAAIRDTGRALGMSFGETDRVARLIPQQLNITLADALEKSSDLKQVYNTEAPVKRLVDTARDLEGVARHAGTHAAAVVISRDPLIEAVPLQRPVRGDDDAIPMTQWAMNQCADVGLLKMDFLGLSNLTILDSAVRLIEERNGERVDYQNLPDGDAETFAMLARGETFGVFQLESSGMRRVVRDMKPTGLADLAALVALYRPGPMEHIPRYVAGKHGETEIEYPHPDLAEILDETYGVIVYQDQVLHIARKFSGYSLGQADIMRKAMGKKIAEVMQAERGRFVEGALANGYSSEEAQTVFNLVEPFAGYAFNKAHAVCYGTIAYQTAYLKAHYPALYMTAVLRSAHGQQERVGLAIAECARLGIPMLPPDVNRSGPSFDVEELPDGRFAIRFGLTDVKNVGSGAVEALIRERTENGQYESVEVFCRRADLRNLNKRALESLMKAGAFDGLGARGSLLAGIDRIVRLAQREQELRDTGQTTMFDLFGQQVDTPRPELTLDEADITHAELLHWEKELLGAYVSAHPFQRAAADVNTYVTAQCGEISEEMDGQEAIIAGMVNLVRPLTTKKGDAFCAAEIEDLSGSVEVTVWPDLYRTTRDLWTDGTIILAHVKIRTRGDRLTVAVENITTWTERPDGESGVLSENPATWAARPGERTARRGNGARSQNASTTGGASTTEGTSATGRGSANGGRVGSAAERPPAGSAGHAADAPPAHMVREAPAAAPPPAASDRPPSTDTGGGAPVLHIRLRETDDESANQARLHETMQLVREAPGNARTLLTVTGVAEEVTLALPHCTPSYALVRSLEEALGEHGTAEIVATPATAPV